jgi:group I intron endonuclease
MTIGRIYVITNLVTGMYYIGQTRQRNPAYRFRSHIRGSIPSSISQAIAEYGIESFSFEIAAETTDLSLVDNLERVWIALTAANSKAVGYNRTCGGHKRPSSAEERARHSERMRGKTAWNKGTKGIVGVWNKGRKQTPEHIKNALAARAGRRNLSAETRRKISEAHKGMKPSADTLVKLSESHRGQSPSAEHRKKLSDALKGRVRVFTDEHRRNIVLAGERRRLKNAGGK